MSIRILLADNHPILLLGLTALVRQHADLHLLGAVSAGADVTVETERLRPDVLVLDLAFPDMNGLELLPVIRRRARRTRILILSVYDDPEHAQSALSRGATGYVVKDAVGGEVLEAIRQVAQGRRYVSESLQGRLRELPAGRTEPLPLHETLTLREREVLQLACRGLANGEIAAKLFIGVRTVETHRANLMRKLHVKNQAELFLYAGQHGLIGAPPPLDQPR